MSEHCIVGYCPELYDALQSVAHQALPYEPIDEWPPHARQYNDDDRQSLIDKLVKALGGSFDSYDLEREYEYYVKVLFDAIQDEALKELILAGNIKKFIINRNGYYLIKQGAFSK